MTKNNDTLYFSYDASGVMSVTYNGTVYQYVTNMQGDIVAIISPLTGEAVVEYTYDAWGNILSTGGSMKDTLGAINPLRYRGYVYDQETGLYYLQSRYYNPTWGRFLNADAYISTGLGALGSNMFAYCCNNPVNLYDTLGTYATSAFRDIHNGMTRGTQEMEVYYNSTKEESSNIIEELLENATDVPEEGLTFSLGLNVNGNWGGTGAGWSGCVSVDKSHNYALQSTDTLCASGGGVGTTCGISYTFTNAKNVQDLTGVSDIYGGTICAGLGLSVDILKFSPASNPNTVNWGICISINFGAEAEIHRGQGYTRSTPSWNPLKKLKELLFGG